MLVKIYLLSAANIYFFRIPGAKYLHVSLIRHNDLSSRFCYSFMFDLRLLCWNLYFFFLV